MGWFPRYSRQVDIISQESLSRARVLVVGAGGLGSSVLYYLVAGGVGNIKFVDQDRVEESNLNRQILHFTDDIGKPKVFSAYEKLSRLNPFVNLVPIYVRVDEESLEFLLDDIDIVVDCLDNMETRFLLNDVCYGRGVPLVHCAVEGWEGRVAFINPRFSSPCMRCIYGDIEGLGKRLFNVVGVTPGIGGMIEASIVLNYLNGNDSLLAGELLIYDLLTLDFYKIRVEKRRGCKVCGGG